MAGYSKTYTLDFTSSGDTVYQSFDKLEDNIDDVISFINAIKKSYASPSAPTSPAPDEGQRWYDSTNDELHVYNGSSWGSAIFDSFKVKADSSDSTEGYLNAKVQNSIVVDIANHRMHLSGDSSNPGNNYFYATDSGGTKGWNPLIYTQLVSSNDTTPGYLNGKLLAGSGISLTEGNDGGDETLTIAQTASSGGITQAYLATSTGSVNTSSSGQSLTLPGGSYGFYPQIKASNALYAAYWAADDAFGELTAATTNSTTYVTNIYLAVDVGGFAYAQQRYVTSSGEVFWIFLLRDKITGEPVAGYQSPDHPCFGNGGDPLLVEHPFPSYDSSKHEIIVINPDSDEVKKLREMCKVSQQRDILGLFFPTYDDGKIVADPLISISNIERKYPKDKVTVGIVDDEDVFESWRKLDGNKKVMVNKMAIPQPDYVKVREMRIN